MCWAGLWDVGAASNQTLQLLVPAASGMDSTRPKLGCSPLERAPEAGNCLQQAQQGLRVPLSLPQVSQGQHSTEGRAVLAAPRDRDVPAGA